jgi:hypothetical protein
MATGLFEQYKTPKGTLEEKYAKEINTPNTTLNELVSLLLKNNAYPKTQAEFKQLPEDAYGSFDKWKNQLRINLSKGATEAVYPHELNHALDNMLQNKAMSIQLIPTNMRTNDEQQFYDAFTKFREETKMPLTGINEYRSSPNELRSFGVGNFATNSQYPVQPAPPHIDATMAQEAAIMRDLAKRQTTPTDENGIFSRTINKIFYGDPMGNTIGSSIR